MARKRKGRPLDGVILVDKPDGWSSNGVLQKVRWLFQAQKAGHTGALDPLATGLLPICLGEATKFSRFLLDADKAYRATARLGVRTDTLDAEGEVIDTQPVPTLQRETVEQLLAERFTGAIEQVPPMYSALKRDGQKLYDLARQGKTVEREARPVQIFSLTLVELHDDELVLDVHCSKGTYIRTLVDDIGTALGCGAHITALRRTRHGRFSLDQAQPLQTLIDRQETQGHEASDEWLLPLQSLLVDLPVIELTEAQGRRFSHGNPVNRFTLETPFEGLAQAVANGHFLGVGEVDANGELRPLRVVATNAV
ncbi:tRNA pseudouridine(55) synthase TruB [Saccharospirillum sp. MSK14-1]|uniref:tRNA pseudouridine(55) synthase TruB n=1 Tax=Saccharospirillum sp. MSK14-1 TaxID=1897632 RepID=UPI000D3DA929|nr:tRNA pseudouridine(55) synthase TruB [Saccharospirillum sp. MSK14-1]PTY39028.1 tRNA pseudouridine(55) synthase TruB [Saccharospirillum sp. MSK14-1]